MYSRSKGSMELVLFTGWVRAAFTANPQVLIRFGRYGSGGDWARTYVVG